MREICHQVGPSLQVTVSNSGLQRSNDVDLVEDACGLSRSKLEDRCNLEKAFPTLELVLFQKHNRGVSVTYSEVAKVITNQLKKSCSEQVFQQLVFLCPDLYSIEWRGDELYVAPKALKQLSLLDMKQRQEAFLQKLNSWKGDIPRKTLPSKPPTPDYETAKEMLEKSRSLFQRVLPETQEETSAPPVKKARGFDAILAKIKKRQELAKSLQLFDSVERRDEDKVEQISFLKRININFMEIILCIILPK